MNQYCFDWNKDCENLTTGPNGELIVAGAIGYHGTPGTALSSQDINATFNDVDRAVTLVIYLPSTNQWWKVASFSAFEDTRKQYFPHGLYYVRYTPKKVAVTAHGDIVVGVERIVFGANEGSGPIAKRGYLIV